MSEIKVEFRHTANFFLRPCRIKKKPTGSPFPAAKNLSKLEGDQVGHRCMLSQIRAVLCSAALRIRMSTDQWMMGCVRIPGNKKAHTGAISIGGSSLHGLSWNISINLGWMYFTHTYYNKVGTRIERGAA